MKTRKNTQYVVEPMDHHPTGWKVVELHKYQRARNKTNRIERKIIQFFTTSDSDETNHIRALHKCDKLWDLLPSKSAKDNRQ